MNDVVCENQIFNFSRGKQRHNTRRQFQKRLVFEREVRRELEKANKAQRRQQQRNGFSG